MILAPTGSAATLLAGYTYHSALGIHDNMDFGGSKNIAQVREKLDGVDYMFIDEVSMLSCHDMYKICAQMAKAFEVHDAPFGRKMLYSLVTLHNCLLLVEKNLYQNTIQQIIFQENYHFA